MRDLGITLVVVGVVVVLVAGITASVAAGAFGVVYLIAGAGFVRADRQ